MWEERVICCIYHSASRFVLKMNNKTITVIFFSATTVSWAEPFN